MIDYRIFTSESSRNIATALGSRKFAFKQNKAFSKLKDIRNNDLGLLYCSEDKSFYALIGVTTSPVNQPMISNSLWLDYMGKKGSLEPYYGVFDFQIISEFASPVRLEDHKLYTKGDLPMHDPGVRNNLDQQVLVQLLKLPRK